MKDYKPGIWYRDGSSCFILEESGRLQRQPDGSVKAELRNRFYFSIQHFDSGFPNRSTAQQEVLAQKIVDLLNADDEFNHQDVEHDRVVGKPLPPKVINSGCDFIMSTTHEHIWEDEADGHVCKLSGLVHKRDGERFRKPLPGEVK